MGHQQILLLVFSVIAVGLLIMAGIMLVNHHMVSTSKDSIIENLASLGRMAYGYRIMPAGDGGGGGSYAGFSIPAKLASNDEASFESNATPTRVVIRAVSTRGYGSITAILDSTGGVGGY